jgi:DNA-binding HxlR family transcriptional regulator
MTSLPVVGSLVVSISQQEHGVTSLDEEEGSLMSGANTDVPSMAATALPLPVAEEEYGQCPVTDVVHRMGNKWTLLVIALLARRPHRYNELHRAIQGISQRMLTRTVRDLEQDGIVRRTVFPTVPVTVEYSMTDLGQSFLVPLSAIADWAVAHHAEMTAARQTAGGR